MRTRSSTVVQNTEMSIVSHDANTYKDKLKDNAYVDGNSLECKHGASQTCAKACRCMGVDHDNTEIEEVENMNKEEEDEQGRMRQRGHEQGALRDRSEETQREFAIREESEGKSAKSVALDKREDIGGKGEENKEAKREPSL